MFTEINAYKGTRSFPGSVSLKDRVAQNQKDVQGVSSRALRAKWSARVFRFVGYRRSIFYFLESQK